MKHPYYHEILVWAADPETWVWQFKSIHTGDWVVWGRGVPPTVETAENYTFRLVHKDWLADPDGVEVYVRRLGTNYMWLRVGEDVHQWDHDKYQFDIRPRRRRTITLPEREIPEPLREEPAHGSIYYIADPTTTEDPPTKYYWYGDSCDKEWLKHGLIYATADDAAAAARAMYPIQGDE